MEEDWDNNDGVTSFAPTTQYGNNNNYTNGPKANDWDMSTNQSDNSSVNNNYRNSSREFGSRNRNRDCSDSYHTLNIDKAHVGSIIGRGGANIREIQQRFNVNIKIGKPFPNAFCSIYNKFTT